MGVSDGSYSSLPGSMHNLPGMVLIHTASQSITNSAAALQRQPQACTAAPVEFSGLSNGGSMVWAVALTWG